MTTVKRLFARLRPDRAPSAPAPLDLADAAPLLAAGPAEGLLLGTTGTGAPVWWDPGHGHAQIVGGDGSGGTWLTLSLASQHMSNGGAVLVIDGGGGWQWRHAAEAGAEVYAAHPFHADAGEGPYAGGREAGLERLEQVAAGRAADRDAPPPLVVVDALENAAAADRRGGERRGRLSALLTDVMLTAGVRVAVRTVRPMTADAAHLAPTLALGRCSRAMVALAAGAHAPPELPSPWAPGSWAVRTGGEWAMVRSAVARDLVGRMQPAR